MNPMLLQQLQQLATLAPLTQRRECGRGGKHAPFDSEKQIGRLNITVDEPTIV